jgi:hypothetical protein
LICRNLYYGVKQGRAGGSAEFDEADWIYRNGAIGQGDGVLITASLQRRSSYAE